MSNSSGLGPTLNGRDFNFFKKITVSNSSFNNLCDVTVGVSPLQNLLFINEGTDTVSYSFNGTTIHGELDPSSGTQSIVLYNPGINKIWFKLDSGSSSTVKIQSNAVLMPPTTQTVDGYVSINNLPDTQKISFIQDSLDAFARLRVSNPKTIFDSKQLADSAALWWDDQQISGSGTTSTYLTNKSATQLSVSANTAGTRVRQTYRNFNYQPGKSLLVMMTGVLGSAASGITRRIGYFNTNNGLFFQLSGSTLSVVVRSFTSGSVANTIINQLDFNLDKLDGTGVSGITLDTSKTQIFLLDFEWLGVGSVRFGVVINGMPVYIHKINNANALSEVYMQYPNLPLRYEISNDGTGISSSLVHICSSVIVEGGREQTGVALSIDRGATVLTTGNNTNIYPLVAIRLKSTHLFASIKPRIFSIICTSTAAYRYVVLLNPTVTGTAFSFTGLANSAIEYDVSRVDTTTLSGGVQIVSGYQLAQNDSTLIVNLNTDLQIGSSISGVSDVLVLAVQRLTGGNESFYGSLSWLEEQ